MALTSYEHYSQTFWNIELESVGGVWIILIEWDDWNNLSLCEGGGVTGEEEMTPVEALSL